ncbi:arsenite efflux ATP-binding protein ArsA [Candidatus Koribacter versatilis Ellin345]|uniref:arsenite-transporting ATPase n=1 Tax=Koribacter versatilis (strain Ellin345) TaxID=204669 RepID=Q1INY9_KORVE|nr:ArsA family ATPase [Candidatus Koribacter versatilis]ABF41411.1 arsenite efflux ATP-binding protein ArsA [Candidatus Koribacter versatilis Ellin345]
MPSFTFVIGKGGVGKTTVAASLALHTANTHPRAKTLLLSTDPAHSLADVLETKLGDTPKKLKAKGALYARELDASAAVEEFLAAQREGILRILESGSLFTRDEIAPLLDSALPGMAEVAALLAIHDLLESDYDEVIVDTAPMGHTLRLFELPAHLERFLHLLEVSAGRDAVLAAHFGGSVSENQYVARWQEMVRKVAQSLDHEHARLLLVTSSEKFSLNEAIRAREQLQRAPVPMEIAEIVLNRAVTAVSGCKRCTTAAKKTVAARRFLAKEFKRVPLRTGEDPGSPIAGVDALTAFGKHVFEGRALRLKQSKPVREKALDIEEAQWPVLNTPLTLTLGKGGVGKTTISAAMAFHARAKNAKEAVCICSIDPAPSLDDVFQTEVTNQLAPVLDDAKLFAAEIDAVGEYQRWAEEMRARVEDATSTEVRGVHLDLSFERDLFLAILDVVPPGVDELFATFRILDLVERGGRVQIDMAPTGHALEVLRTPARLLGWARVLLKTLAHHRTLPLARDAAVEIATVSQRVRELSTTLSDSKRSQVWVVMLAEPLPDRETRRLLCDLQELKAPVAGVFVNRVLMDETHCPRCSRAQAWQRQTLAKMKDGAFPVFVVPEMPEEIAGARGLQRFTKSLWRLQ